MFCSRIEEAKALSVSLNARGVCCLALTGSDSEDARKKRLND